jgi:hypothetical protein
MVLSVIRAIFSRGVRNNNRQMALPVALDGCTKDVVRSGATSPVLCPLGGGAQERCLVCDFGLPGEEEWRPPLCVDRCV